ncbi:MAG: glycosyltransferase [Saprospiraceae bacterium]
MATENLNILFIIPSYKPAYVYGGPIRSVSALCEALVEVGHNVNVFTTTANGETELDVIPGNEYNIDGVNVTYFKRQTKDHSNLSAGLFQKVLGNCQRFDIIHIQSWWNFVAVFSVIACKLKSVQPLISPRGSLIPYTFGYRNVFLKKWLHKLIGKRLLENSILHFTSNKEKEDADKYLNKERSFIIPNILSLPDRIYGKKQDGCLRLVFVGRIDPKKNLELVLKALKSRGNYNRISLDIIGDGDKNYVNKLKQFSGEMTNVTWRGMLDGELKFKLLSESDLLVLLSHNENYGNVVLEALCQGTPVIISKYVGAGEYVKKNKLGWVIDLSESEFVETLNGILSQDSELKEMQHRAEDCIKRDFERGRQVLEYEKMYFEIRNTHIKHDKKK